MVATKRQTRRSEKEEGEKEMNDNSQHDNLDQDKMQTGRKGLRSQKDDGKDVEQREQSVGTRARTSRVAPKDGKQEMVEKSSSALGRNMKRSKTSIEQESKTQDGNAEGAKEPEGKDNSKGSAKEPKTQQNNSKVNAGQESRSKRVRKDAGDEAEPSSSKRTKATPKGDVEQQVMQQQQQQDVDDDSDEAPEEVSKGAAQQALLDVLKAEQAGRKAMEEQKKFRNREKEEKMREQKKNPKKKEDRDPRSSKEALSLDVLDAIMREEQEQRKKNVREEKKVRGKKIKFPANERPAKVVKDGFILQKISSSAARMDERRSIDKEALSLLDSHFSKVNRKEYSAVHSRSYGPTKTFCAF
mmetsp:Transcript_33937/g.106380  ORF Transcript_33937/g.106380 Transcript_33937/m.106380 type:complete len:356 (-) Transcript_33937:48-1115(-)